MLYKAWLSIPNWKSKVWRFVTGKWLRILVPKPNKQHLPLEITQNFTVQWADFWRLWQIGIHAKKHSTLQKARLSIELTQYWEWAEYNTLNFAQFFPNDDQFILRFYFFTLTRPKMMNVLIWRHDDVIGATVINYSSKACLFGPGNTHVHDLPKCYQVSINMFTKFN